MGAKSSVNSGVAFYARYSSELQNPRSIEDQVARLREELARRGGKPANVQVFADAETSGTVWERPGLQALLRAIAQGTVSSIFVEDVSRLSRDGEDQARLRKLLEHHEVRLVSVADGFELDGSSGASLMFAVKSAVSDNYLRDLSDKTRRGLQGNARQGKATGGRTYGYRTRDDGQVQVVEAEAHHVRDIFERYAAGSGYATIAAKLNSDGVDPPRTKRRAGSGWMASCIREMLRNPKYIGRWTFGRRKWTRHPETRRRVARVREERDHVTIERPELAIIDRDLWEAVQARLAEHAKAYKRQVDTGVPRHRTDYLLSSLLRCAVCGGLMQLSGGSPHRYYRCVQNRKRGTCTNRLSVRESTARERILAKVREELSTPSAVDYIRKRIAERLGDVSRRVEAELAERVARLGRTEERVKNLIVLQLDGDRSEYLTDMRRDLEAQAMAEKAAISALRDRASTPLRLPDIGLITVRVQALDALLRGNAVEQGREALRRYLKNGTILLHPGDDGIYTAKAEFLPLVAILEAEPPPGVRRRCPHPVARGSNDVWATAVVVLVEVRLTG